MPQYTALVTLLVVLFYVFLGTRVSAARRKFGVKLPAVTGHPDFDRVQRAHMNALEWAPIFLPVLWLCAVYFSDTVAAVLGLVWIAARVVYYIGYSTAVERRLPGFLIQAVTCLVLLICALIGIVTNWPAT